MPGTCLPSVRTDGNMHASNKCDLVRLLVLHVWVKERCKSLHPLPSLRVKRLKQRVSAMLRGVSWWRCLDMIYIAAIAFQHLGGVVKRMLTHSHTHQCLLSLHLLEITLGAKCGALGSSRGTVRDISSCPFGGRWKGNLGDKHKNRKVMCEWKKRINGGL